MIGLKIRDLRKKRGLTQIDLATGIMHRCALIRIENGLSSPNFERLMKIAKKLGVSIDYFTTENRQTEMELQISPDIQCDLLEMLNKRANMN